MRKALGLTPKGADHDPRSSGITLEDAYVSVHERQERVSIGLLRCERKPRLPDTNFKL
jgi:hypothetical protein